MKFYKYQGTGNDFVLIDNRNDVFKGDSPAISRLCDRRFGIGGDGLILLENSEIRDFKMVYYNADGKESSMCGNGGRCLSMFAHLLGVCGDSGSFEAIDGPHRFEISGGQVKLQMADITKIERNGDDVVMDTGSPHYVMACDDLKQLDIVLEARKVRYNETYKEKGINVNFTTIRGHRIFMRTYERGVENETLSCGTGTVAVALAAALKDSDLKSPAEINAPGGRLKVYFQRIDEGFSDIWLEGPTELVFQGEIDF